MNKNNKDMTNLIKKYGVLILLAMFAMTSCMDKNARENNYPGNGNYDLPVGDVYTIDTLLQMWHLEGTHQFTDDASVYGVVTADETTGNIYKASFIQDGDYSIELYLKSTSGLRIGDSVRVYLKGATLSEYSGTPQIQDLDPNYITKLANNITVAPDTISTLDVNADFICRLVTFTNVEFRAADRQNTYAPEDEYGQYNLAQYDENGIRVDESIMVRTSNYASFRGVTLPQGNGMITGIVTYYSGTGVYQFTIRSLSEVKMENEPYEAAIVFPEGTGTQDDPYNIAGGIAYQGAEELQWIEGYIVGSANIVVGTITNDSQITWEPPFAENANMTNIILADNANERDINNCVIVYLPSNAPSGIQGINLKDNEDNLGKTLKVHGKLKSYLGKSGMQETNEYELN